MIYGLIAGYLAVAAIFGCATYGVFQEMLPEEIQKVAQARGVPFGPIYMDPRTHSLGSIALVVGLAWLWITIYTVVVNDPME